MKATIYKSISQLITPLGHSAVKGKEMDKLKIINDAAFVVENGYFTAVGNTEEILNAYSDKEYEVVDLQEHCVLPGFVDSHTHFLFGGYRPQEFMKRLEGVDYIEIHKMGGGIQSTVNSTRSSDLKELVQSGKERILDYISMGVTTIEGKSGYGLDRECELKQLEAMKKLDEELPVDIVTTYLGAHSIPEEYRGESDKYIDFIIEEMLPIIKSKGLAEFVDVFCEEEVFDIKQSEKLLKAAKDMGFKTKIHADEIVSTGGAGLAAKIGLSSADHLLMITDSDIEKLSKSDVVATLLPNTAFCLNKVYAPARKIIDSGCAVAIASDYNPGSCFSNSIPLLLALSVINMKMTLNEAICALTINGAAAIEKADELGSIEVGKKADFIVLEYPRYEFLIYHTCKNVVEKVYKKGVKI